LNRSVHICMYLCIHTPCPREDNTIYWVSFENNRINSVPTTAVFPQPTQTFSFQSKARLYGTIFGERWRQSRRTAVVDWQFSGAGGQNGLVRFDQRLRRRFPPTRIFWPFHTRTRACRIFNYFPLCRRAAITITNNFLRTFQYTTIENVHMLFLPTDFSPSLNPNHIILS